MNEQECDEWAEQMFGGKPTLDLLELCQSLSFDVMAIVTDPDLYFRHQRIDLTRLVIQDRLLSFAAEIIRRDRCTEGPAFFGTKPQTFGWQPRAPKPSPPLRSWIRRNAKKRPG